MMVLEVQGGGVASGDRILVAELEGDKEGITHEYMWGSPFLFFYKTHQDSIMGAPT